jgi:manganese/zinc/iron transport system ATP- binding protein
MIRRFGDSSIEPAGTIHPPQRAEPRVDSSTKTDPAPVVSVRGLTVSYGQRPVLRSVSFDVQRGNLVGIVGPNGAGKSTLLKAMLGLIEAESGTVIIDGRPASDCRDRVAYVPQTEAVDWDFPVTVFDVVLMGRYGRLGWFSRPGRADRVAAAEALALVGMEDFRDRHIRQLSGGQQQRVFLARALSQQADILLLDEPFAGVDAATEQAIFELIDRLTAEGKTMLVVNHDLSILNRFDYVMLLNERVVAFGPTDQVLTDQNLRRTYGGRLTLLERAETVLQQNPAKS